MEQQKILKTEDNARVTALLSEGAQFEGKLNFEGTVRIGGRFRGEIFTFDTLIITESGHVEAEIEAKNVFLSGQVVGNIKASGRVVMSPPARFQGTITSPSLKIEEGVIFEGASFVPDN